MNWFWYWQGFEACLFTLSVLLNIGFAKGYVRYNRPQKTRTFRVYDQDNSGEYKRAV
jgi:hypothetical protein